MKKASIKVQVNEKSYEMTVEPGERLVDLLRDRLGLTGTKEGCGEGECGACTINMNGQAVLSCLLLAVQADGAVIETIEGLQQGEKLHPLQEAFVSESAVQCGYCTPGMIMASKTLIQNNPNPSERKVREALSNNICRCTGYDRPIKAVLKAAAQMREASNG